MRRIAARAFRWPWLIFAVALAFRLGNMHAGQIAGSDAQDHITFGYEVGRIARSLLEGHGYGSPFLYASGPTAWLGPVYPLMMTACFKLFGVYTMGAARAILALNSLFAALTCVVIYRIGQETLDENVGAIAAWIFALMPFEIGFIRWVWDTSLSALLLSFAFLVTVRMERSARWRSWIWFGAVWGVVALSNPTLLSFLPPAAAWLWWKQRAQKPLRYMVAAGVVFAALLSPWVVRNYMAFHKFVPLRSNVAEELYMGNHEGSQGYIMLWDHPIWNDAEMAEYAQRGEIAYLADKMQIVKAWLRAHPGRFVELSLKRVLIFWAGVPQGGPVMPHMGTGSRHALYFGSSVVALWGLVRVIRRRQRAAFLYASVIGLYPLVFYITHNHARYRHPIEPIMCVLAAYLFYTAAQDEPWLIGRRKRESSMDAAALVATGSDQVSAD